MTVIIAPAKGSPTASAPASARTAITSTLGRRRRTAATVQATEATRPRAVPAVHGGGPPRAPRRGGGGCRR